MTAALPMQQVLGAIPGNLCRGIGVRRRAEHIVAVAAFDDAGIVYRIQIAAELWIEGLQRLRARVAQREQRQPR